MIEDYQKAPSGSIWVVFEDVEGCVDGLEPDHIDGPGLLYLAQKDYVSYREAWSHLPIRSVVPVVALVDSLQGLGDGRRLPPGSEANRYLPFVPAYVAVVRLSWANEVGVLIVE